MITDLSVVIKTSFLFLLLPTLSYFPHCSTTLLSNTQEKAELVLGQLMESSYLLRSLEELQAAQTKAACGIRLVCRVHVPPSSLSPLLHLWSAYRCVSLGHGEYRRISLLA